VSNLIHNLNFGKSSPKLWAISLKKLPKANTHPMGKNSPNLVTLLVGAQLEDI
jgi:hypothetical protein